MSFLKLPTIGKPQSKRRNYDISQISLAYNAVKDGMSVYRAARVYGVPESTLRDRHLHLQPVENVPTHGPSPLLSRDEEDGLVQHVTYMSQVGYGYSRQTFLDLANEYAVVLGKKIQSDPTFKSSWYRGFKRRWPKVHLAKPEKLGIIRAKATSKEALQTHFSELKEAYKLHGVENRPERIWNLDESGIQLEHTPPKVICTKGSTPQAVTSPRGKNITIIGCDNAVGVQIPLFFVFPGKWWMADLTVNCTPGTAGGMSESGWSNGDIFRTYLAEHFLRYVPRVAGQKHLIILDGHTSHSSITLTQWGQQHGIEFFILPPHTSHVTQPLDVACFGPMKSIYNYECQKYMRLNPGQTISKYVVGQLASKAYLKALSPDNLVSAFRKTGLYPLCHDAISEEKVMPSSIHVTNTTSQNSQYDNSDNEILSQGQHFLKTHKITNVKATQGKKRPFAPSIVGNLSTTKNTALFEARPPPAKKALKLDQPCCSKENINSKTVNIDSEDSSMSISDDEEEPCCVCHKRMPPAMKLAYVLEIANWVQCDKCQHWTHLKYCSKVRVVRRCAPFMCPHCDPTTSD